MRDAFDRVSKKQKVSYSKTQDVIDKVQTEIEKAAKALLEIPTEEQTAGDQTRVIMSELQTRLGEMGPSTQVGASQKEVNLAVNKYGKVVDKLFQTDISNSYRDVDCDSHSINQIVALHFYRQGLFDLGDCFVNEAQEPNGACLKAPFFEMYKILEQMRAKDLEPALRWAALNRESLQKKGSALEFKLHQLQYVSSLHQGGWSSALQYARRWLTPFSPQHMGDIQRLMGCMIYAGRLETSPYADFLSATHWDSVALEFTRECCSLLGQAYQSPLHVTLSAGSQALPTLLKLASVMANKKNEWQNMKQLPVEIELDKEFQFHSIFACPVSRDQSTAENPPMLMPCGHVLCKQSIAKLVKGSFRTFKCPYCPSETTSAQCRQIYF